MMQNSSMDSYVSTVGHPYGVKPPGNAYFETNRRVIETRSRGLGKLGNLSDENLIEFLSFMTSAQLIAFALTSRAFYVYCHHGDLWRDLTLSLCNGEVKYFHHTWKDTYASTWTKMKCSIASDVPLHVPIKINGIYSNLLHRSWSCYSCDLNIACPGFATHSDIQIVDGSSLSVDQFIAQYELPNKPVVIRNSVSHWPAFHNWTDEYLIKNCGDFRFRGTSATAPLSATFTIAEYLAYGRACREEAPLYLFERQFSSASSIMVDDYEVPKYFSSIVTPTTDLFRVLGEHARPDHRWLICGPARSGSLFHIDPNMTNAWNVCIRGRKKWIFYPPNVSPPGVVSSADGADVTVPISTGEWLLTFWKQHLEARRNPDVSQRPLEVTANEGDVVFVPHGYWHMVVNLEACVALTYNYTCASNLSNCLRFLREKPDQISGVRDRVEEAVQPEEFYTKFLEGLSAVLPSDKLQEYVNTSFRRPRIDNSCCGADEDEADATTGRLFQGNNMSYGKRRKRNAVPATSNNQGNCSDEFKRSCPVTDSNIDDDAAAMEPIFGAQSFSFGFLVSSN